MRNPLLFLLGIALLTGAVPSYGQATLSISVPDDTPVDWDIHVAGSFNNWTPDHPNYVLARQDDGTYSIELPSGIRGTIEFKFAAGNWGIRELYRTGNETVNRSLAIPSTGSVTYTGEVQAWSSWTWPMPGSTASPNVSIMDPTFEIPQLGKNRRVWVYLPPDYATSDKTYSVTYAFDGQYLFDKNVGQVEMGIDETLDAQHAAGWEVGIVVGIDRAVASAERLDEMLPWNVPGWGGGDGALVGDFVVETLKPHVDASYRTRPGRDNTAVMGISAGGSLATWIGMTHSDVFSKVLGGSPALFINPQIYDYAAGLDHVTHPVRYAFTSGTQESGPWDPGVFAEGQETLVNTLVSAGVASHNISSEIHTDGDHLRTYWRREFPDMYRWLFDLTSVATEDQPLLPVDSGMPAESGMDVYPNPGRDLLQVRVPDLSGSGSLVQLFDILGRQVAVSNSGSDMHRLETAHLAPGMYLVRAGSKTSTWMKR